MLSIIKELLLKIINDIDTGNSNLSAKECEEVIDYLSFISNKNEKLSKYQACKYLNIVELLLIIMFVKVKFQKEENNKDLRNYSFTRKI